MKKNPAASDLTQPTRREMISGVLKTMLVAGILPAIPAEAATANKSWRVINIMNFIRGVEPRAHVDLMAPVRGQMALIKQHKLPATWLLQYDALTEGPFVDFLKSEIPADHETGIWFEMNQRLCDDAGIPWRGKPGWEWDYHVPIAYAIGYTPDQRRRLADTAVATHKRIFGRDPKTVASWNLDAITVAHFADHHGIDAFGNCRDQLNTDGFTIWGAPIAAYYPNRVNAWSPALDPKNQISAPIFRLLGQDPVYYYDNTLPYPDTMEPVWKSGQSEIFADHFFDMIAHAPTQSLAYAQLGQENSFSWPAMSKAYPMQMEKLGVLRNSNQLVVETMEETGRRFKHAFKSTPTQAQVMLSDPYGNTNPPEKTIWYQSKFHRANLHFRGNDFYLRDLHVYADNFPQPYLNDPTTITSIQQRMLAVLDGYHWSDDAVHAGHEGIRAMGRFIAIAPNGDETQLTLTGTPQVTETATTLRTTVPLAIGGNLIATFSEREIAFNLSGTPSPSQLGLIFEWVPDRNTLQNVSATQLNYTYANFNYSIQIANANATKTPTGAKIIATGKSPLRLLMAQQT